MRPIADERRPPRFPAALAHRAGETAVAKARRIPRRFTLVELLLVVAVFLVLVALLLPALGQARRQARRVLCISNLRQWQVMLASYAGDHNTWLPPPCGSDRANFVNFGDWTAQWWRYQSSFEVNPPAFRALLEPYGLCYGIAFCPDGWLPQAMTAPNYNRTTYTSGSYDVQWGYSYHAYRGGGIAPYPIEGPRRLKDHRTTPYGYPAVLIADASAYHSPINWSPYGPPFMYTHANHPNERRPGGTTMYDLNQNTYIAFGVHNGYIDGHIEWLNFDSLNQSKHLISHWKYNLHWQ